MTVSENDVLNKIIAEIEEQKEYRCLDDSDEDMRIYRSGLNDAIDIVYNHLSKKEK